MADHACPGPVSAGRRRNVNCLKNVVIWYEDHKHRCPYEPRLAELDPTFGLYTTAVWQCEAGHRYFQDLHSPLKPLSDSDPESDKGGSSGRGHVMTVASRGSAVPPGYGPRLTPSLMPVSQTSQQLQWHWLQGQWLG